MINALWLGAAAMSAQQLKVDTIANNLANVNTTGYKRGRVNFQELVYVPEGAGAATAAQAQAQANAGQAPAAAQPAYGPVTVLAGTGIRPIGVERLTNQGIIQNTGIETDLALDGDGYFAIAGADGATYYTRDGHFGFDGAGNLVTAGGHRVVIDGAAPLPAGAKEFTIAADGTVTATVGGQQTPSQLGRISLFRFANPGGLDAIGHNLFQATEASGEAAPDAPQAGPVGPGALATRVRQGYLETSNVSVLDEMVGLMQAQRAYEMSAKVIQNADQLMAIANGLRR
ncbi:MAG: flagellar hook-basal body protein [Bacillota bacterium]